MALLENDVASRHLGIEIDAVSPGRATARMTIGPLMINGHGMAHGGYVFLLADTAFAFACNTYERPTVARGCEVTFLRPASQGDRLVAQARERIREGRNGIYDVSVRTESGDPIAELRGHSTELRES